ncbi:MAG: hypothetical protein AAF568_01935 [Pseudomonadota bacterium]
MYKRKPDFLDDLTEHEKELVRCCAAGEDCIAVNTEKVAPIVRRLFDEEKRKPETNQRNLETIKTLAVREWLGQDEAAPTIRAELIRYLLLGGDDDHPVDPSGVRILGAWITGVLELEGCTNLPILILADCEIAATPILRGARGHTFSFDGSRMSGLEAAMLKTSGGVYLRNGFEATGEVQLVGAEIGGNLDCAGGTFDGAPKSLSLQQMNVSGTLFLRNLKAPPKGRVDLYAAKVGSVNDDPDSWPEKPGDLILNGFRYDRFVGSVTDYASRKDWLERQRETDLTTDFKPQPFEQLAKVLREMGHVEEAKDIAILKLRYQRDTSWRHGKKTIYDLGRYAWGHVFDGLVRFGYRPFRALLYAGIFITIGTLLFWWAGHSVDMVPNNPFLLKSEWKAALSATEPYEAFHWSVPGFQTFSPLVYSIDTFVPLVNLHQEPHWIPSAETDKGCWIRVYLWFHIAAGWVITTLFAASLAGIVKRD